MGWHPIDRPKGFGKQPNTSRCLYFPDVEQGWVCQSQATVKTPIRRNLVLQLELAANKPADYVSLASAMNQSKDKPNQSSAKMGSPTPVNVLEQRRHGLTNIFFVSHAVVAIMATEGGQYISFSGVISSTHWTTYVHYDHCHSEQRLALANVANATDSPFHTLATAGSNSCTYQRPPPSDQGLPLANVPNAINSPFHTLATAGSKSRL